MQWSDVLEMPIRNYDNQMRMNRILPNQRLILCQNCLIKSYLMTFPYIESVSEIERKKLTTLQLLNCLGFDFIDVFVHHQKIIRY